MKFSMNDFIELDLNALLEVNGGSGFCSSSCGGINSSKNSAVSSNSYNYRHGHSANGSCSIGAGNLCCASGSCGTTGYSKAPSKSTENGSAPAAENYKPYIPWKNPGYIVKPKEAQISINFEDRGEAFVQNDSPSSYFRSL